MGLYDRVFGYIVGSNQLMIVYTDSATDSQILIPGVDYTENGTPGDISRSININPPPAGSGMIEFINLSGGMGPSGDAGTVSMQDTYDIAHDVTMGSGQPVIWRVPGAGDSVLEIRVGAGPTNAKILGDGSLAVTKLSISDGAGAFWEFEAMAGQELRIAHSVTGMGWEIPSNFPMLQQIAGGVPFGEPLRWSKYSGTITGTNAETIATGMTTGIHAAMLMIEGSAGGNWWAQEINDSTASVNAVLSYDPTTGEFFIAGDLAGTGVLGGSLSGAEYTSLCCTSRR